jgi:hypothetical protein
MEGEREGEGEGEREGRKEGAFISSPMITSSQKNSFAIYYDGYFIIFRYQYPVCWTRVTTYSLPTPDGAHNFSLNNYPQRGGCPTQKERLTQRVTR